MCLMYVTAPRPQTFARICRISLVSLAMQSCVLYSFVRCGTSNQIEEIRTLPSKETFSQSDSILASQTIMSIFEIITGYYYRWKII